MLLSIVVSPVVLRLAREAEAQAVFVKVTSRRVLAGPATRAWVPAVVASTVLLKSITAAAPVALSVSVAARKSAAQGKRGDLGGRRIIKKKNSPVGLGLARAAEGPTGFSQGSAPPGPPA